MPELRARISSKGQVTVPAEVRRLLGISGRGDYIAFIVDDGEVRLIRRRSVVEETAGAVRVEGPPLTAEELRVAAEIAIAEDVMERMGN